MMMMMMMIIYNYTEFLFSIAALRPTSSTTPAPDQASAAAGDAATASTSSGVRHLAAASATADPSAPRGGVVKRKRPGDAQPAAGPAAGPAGGQPGPAGGQPGPAGGQPGPAGGEAPEEEDVVPAPPRKKRIARRRLSDQDFYQVVRDSVIERHDEPDLDIEETVQPDYDNTCAQLRAFEAAIFSRKALYYCCLAGRNLLQLKKIHKKTNAELDDLFRGAGGEIASGMSKTNRDFFVRLHKLAAEFPRVMYATVPYGDLQRRKLTALKECMRRDTGFAWRPRVGLAVVGRRRR
jgi:hypothetical protein